MENEYFTYVRKKMLQYAKVPDMAKLNVVEDGHGYYGIVLYDPSRDMIQCHICGNWYKALWTHLVKHQITQADYKETFEIPGAVPLTNIAYSEARRESAIKHNLVANLSPGLGCLPIRTRDDYTLGQKYTHLAVMQNPKRRRATNETKQYCDSKAHELTRFDAENIKTMYGSGKYTLEDLAQRYSISISLVRKIVRSQKYLDTTI